MDGRGHVNAGALLQGAALTAVLGGLMLGAFFVHQGAGNDPDHGGEALRSRPRPVHTMTTIAELRPLHLVILVDEGSLLRSFPPVHDAGGRIAAVEVITATETALHGLAEAQVAAGRPCHTSPCPVLTVLDLRFAPADE